MDYGFVQGDKTTTDANDSLITSNEGYNCYLLIADKYSRHLWIFLFANKTPPIDTVHHSSPHMDWNQAYDMYAPTKVVNWPKVHHFVDVLQRQATP